jgi:hypothetical protein
MQKRRPAPESFEAHIGLDKDVLHELVQNHGVPGEPPHLRRHLILITPDQPGIPFAVPRQTIGNVLLVFFGNRFAGSIRPIGSPMPARG